MKKAGEIGECLKAEFLKLQSAFPKLIREVRGFGCMLGVDLARDGQPIGDELQNRGYPVNCTHNTVLRFLPPFVVTRDECSELVQALQAVLRGPTP